MSNRCQVTGAVTSVGRHKTWSGKRNPRRFRVNVQQRRYWAPSLGRHIRLTVSAKGIKVIDRDGIDAVVARLRARGEDI